MPFNQFITFFKPYLNVLAGAIAALLVAKANVLGIPGLGDNGEELQTAIAAALAWALTQGATQLGDAKWLKGHHLQLKGDAEVQAAVLNTQATPPVVPPGVERDALVSLDETLPPELDETVPPEPDETFPSDDEELAAVVVPAPSAEPSGVADADYVERLALQQDLTVDEPDLSADEEDLPDDEEEFAAPPPDETNMPVQPSQVQVHGVSA